MPFRRSAIAAVAALAIAACSSPETTADGGPSGNAENESSAGASTSGGAGTPPGSASAPPEAPGASPSTGAAPMTCAQQTAAGLNPEQKAAQLVLVAMTPSTVDAAGAQISSGHAGGVFMLGGWSGITTTAQATEQIHALAAQTGGIGTWVAIDQEGGEVQQLTGSTVGEIPAAVTQGGMNPADLQGAAKAWGTSLAEAGADINLAPVADVVPESIGTQNAPIGQYGRQYGSTPDAVTPPMLAFMQGMQDAGVIPTVKHFPGIGRILGNTDTTAAGISDEATTASDPALQPFQAAIDAGAPMIMVSTAHYPQLDPHNQAAFSAPIVTDLLRGQMGFGGVVVSDDLGAAKAVADVPVGERLTRLIDAGGDVALTAEPAQAETMNAAAVAKYGSDPQFATKVDAAAERVLTLKDQHGLLPCSA